MMPMKTNIKVPATRRVSRNAGIALFLAISLLALFSVLGASYMRFMSLELDESDLRIRDMRIRNYATAGINSAAAQVRTALIDGGEPRPSYNFTYAVYGASQEGTDNSITPLSTYTAQAHVTVIALGEEAWAIRFGDGPQWPGAMQAFCLVSSVELQRAVPGRILTQAKHTVEAVMVMDNTDYAFLSWHTLKKSDASGQQE
jgi:hypothetical protein